MLSLPTAAAIRAALTKPLDAPLHAILTEILATAETNGIADLTHVLVVDDETEAAIERELGWSPLQHPIDGHRYGEAGFKPYWAWLQRRGSWYQLTHCVGNVGFAYILLIEDAPGTLPDLLAMCREYAGREA